MSAAPRSNYTRISGAARADAAVYSEVTPTPVERAAFYFSNYSLVFPYLCDPSRGTAQAYGLEQFPMTVWDQAKVMMNDPLGAPGLMRETRQGPRTHPGGEGGLEHR